MGRARRVRPPPASLGHVKLAALIDDDPTLAAAAASRGGLDITLLYNWVRRNTDPQVCPATALQRATRGRIRVADWAKDPK